MGNTAAGAREKRPKNAQTSPAAPRRVAVTQRDVEEREEEAATRAAGLCVGASIAAGGGRAPPVSKVAKTVKIVMTRKDAEALVARLNARCAWERKARMAELKRELRVGDGRCGGASPDAWRPRLAPIQES